MPHPGMHQQSSIARKKGTVSFHDLQQKSIFGFWCVKCVQPQETKVARQFAQMTVCDKAIARTRLQPGSRRNNI